MPLLKKTSGMIRPRSTHGAYGARLCILERCCRGFRAPIGQPQTWYDGSGGAATARRSRHCHWRGLHGPLVRRALWPSCPRTNCGIGWSTSKARLFVWTPSCCRVQPGVAERGTVFIPLPDRWALPVGAALRPVRGTTASTVDPYSRLPGPWPARR